MVKDEGASGDRDFIQWDTVSLMSLLDVFVIFAYYEKAKKRGNKITNQQFDNNYVLSKIKEIEQIAKFSLYHKKIKDISLLNNAERMSVHEKEVSIYDLPF